jgi:transposase
MLVVETIAKIRRAHFVDGKSIKQICRELRVSRNTVRKVIRSGATEFTYGRTTQPRPKIDPWRSVLDAMLAENARRPKRERLTLIRIYEDLRNRGYGGSYDAVRRYAASWSKATQAASASAYVPLSFDPGEAYQFDWSHEIVILDGVTVTVKVAHVRLCHSRMPFVRAYPRETPGRWCSTRMIAKRNECDSLRNAASRPASPPDHQSYQWDRTRLVVGRGGGAGGGQRSRSVIVGMTGRLPSSVGPARGAFTTARPCSPLVQEQWSSEDGGGNDLRRQESRLQSPVPADVRALPR